MRLIPVAIILLASFGLTGPAMAQLAASPPLPAAQSAAGKSLVAQAQAALEAKRWPDAEAVLKQLAATEPRWEYFAALGDAQINAGHYEDSIASYQHGIDLGQKIAGSAAIARMYTQIGNDNLKLRKNDAAIAAYTKAAALDPNPGVAYFNLCATQYNVGNTEGAIAACDKAIAADPSRADAYFIKGSLLVGESKMVGDKVVARAGTKEALQKYLALAPNGPHAQDVKQMLDYLK
jgi:tetratricopeptide (TPR) repeat protein